MKINIKKISEMTGFSPATVSNALNRKRGVNRETAEKIIKVAREHGYVTENRIKTIKVVTYRDSGEVFSNSPFFVELLESVENESRRCGYETTLVNLYRREPDYDKMVHELLQDTSSAILLLGTELSAADAEVFQRAQMPLVLMDCWFPQLPFNAVLMNNHDSVCQAVNYLIAQGHERIGYLKGSMRIQNFINRERGFYDTMKEHDLYVNPEFVFEVPASLAGAYETLDQALRSGQQMPTAFFADNDMIALGAMKALQKNNYRIPEDISLIGFDDISFCEVFTPQLSTIKVYKKELGQQAVQKLLEVIRSSSKLRTCTQLCNELVLRESVAKPRAL